MNSDLLIRISSFLGVLTLMALWEVGAPRRSFSMPRGPRWFANITVVVLDPVIVRLLLAAGAVERSRNRGRQLGCSRNIARPGESTSALQSLLKLVCRPLRQRKQPG